MKRRAEVRNIDNENDERNRRSVEFGMEEKVSVVEEKAKACREGEATMLKMAVACFKIDVTRKELESAPVYRSEGLYARRVTIEERRNDFENDWAKDLKRECEEERNEQKEAVE